MKNEGGQGKDAGAWLAKNGAAKLSALILAVAAVGGCGGNAAVVSGNDASVLPDAAVPIGSIVRGTVQPCTEAHTVCVMAKFPASMTARPTKMQIDYYSSIPPTHPPEGIPLRIETPDLVAGETVQLRMTDLGMTGSFYVLGLVFMPGGGYQIPVQAVDYIGDSAASYALTGGAINVPETLDFQFAP